ncbi:hypothetical protein PT2222_400028 [Paraburkholderia tropica]
MLRSLFEQGSGLSKTLLNSVFTAEENSGCPVCGLTAQPAITVVDTPTNMHRFMRYSFSFSQWPEILSHPLSDRCDHNFSSDATVSLFI